MPIFVNPDFQDYFEDIYDDPFHSAPAEAAGFVFETVADARRHTQRKTFDFGYWYIKYIVPDVMERTDRYFCPSDASGCWIPGLIVGTVATMSALSPLFATTLMAYTNPITAAIAFPLDAYNIYRYLD